MSFMKVYLHVSVTIIITATTIYHCNDISLSCCDDGWRITLAGSRFFKPAESRYAPVEGEALAIAWALEQTRYFTLGCEDLLVVTDS